MVAAAVVGAAAIGAVGSSVAAGQQASATNNAANQAANAQNNSLAMQQQQLQAQIALQQQALNQQSQLSAPYRSLGQSAIPQLEGMLGLSPQPVSQSVPPLGGTPGQAQPQQQPYYGPSPGGMGALGGSGVPLGTGGGLAGSLPINRLPNGAVMPGGNVLAQVGPGQQGPQGQPAQQGQAGSMYNPPPTTTNGLPTYAGVLGGYSNLMGSIYGAEGLNPDGTTPAGGPNTTAMTNALRNSPGYQFQLQQGNQNAINQASAQGMSLSGNTLQSLNQFGQGLADTTYQQYLGNLNNTLGAYQGYVGDYQNYLGQLMNATTLGQGAAAGQAANIGNSAAATGAAYQNAGAQSASAYNNLGNIALQQGANNANISANEIAGITKSIGNGINNYTSMNTLNALNNPNGQDIYNNGISMNADQGMPALDSSGASTGYTYSY